MLLIKNGRLIGLSHTVPGYRTLLRYGMYRTIQTLSNTYVRYGQGKYMSQAGSDLASSSSTLQKKKKKKKTCKKVLAKSVGMDDSKTFGQNCWSRPS